MCYIIKQVHIMVKLWFGRIWKHGVRAWGWYMEAWGREWGRGCEGECMRMRERGRGQGEWTRACGRGNEDEGCGADERGSGGMEVCGWLCEREAVWAWWGRVHDGEGVRAKAGIHSKHTQYKTRARTHTHDTHNATHTYHTHATHMFQSVCAEIYKCSHAPILLCHVGANGRGSKK